MRKLLILFLLFFTSFLQASTYWSATIGIAYYGESAASACDLAFQSYHSSNNSPGTISTSVSMFNATLGSCNSVRDPSGFEQSIYVSLQNGVCPSNLVDDGNGQCLEPSPCDYGASAGSGWGRDDEYQYKSCDGTCEIWASTCDLATTIVIDGVDVLFNHCFLTYGDECSIGDTQPSLQPNEPNSSNESCAVGQDMGTFNGSTICVNSATGEAESTVPPEVSTETENSTTSAPTDNGDGTSTTTTITSVTNINSGGATSTTTTTTTTTTDNSTGAVVGQTSEGVTTEHPDQPSQEDGEDEAESTYTANSCSSPISCTGDAIQCALAQQTKDLDCRFENDPSAVIDVDSLGITPAENPSFDDVAVIEDMSDVIDTSSFVASGCPADRTLNFSIGGSPVSFTIEYAPICEVAEMVGNFVLLGAAVMSIKIVGGF